MWMIRGGALILDLISIHENGNYLGSELSSLMKYDLPRDIEFDENVSMQEFSNLLFLDISQILNFNPLGQIICTYQNVEELIGRIAEENEINAPFRKMA